MRYTRVTSGAVSTVSYKNVPACLGWGHATHHSLSVSHTLHFHFPYWNVCIVSRASLVNKIDKTSAMLSCCPRPNSQQPTSPRALLLVLVLLLEPTLM
eukprot:COSAG01_NODE_11746_length_1868_cov_1.820237_1_plen_97_part_10